MAAILGAMHLGALWRRLVEPTAAIASIDRRPYRLIASMLVALSLFGTLSAVVQLVVVPGFLPTFLIVMSAIAVWVLTWWRLRRGQVALAATITAIVPMVGSLGAALADPSDAISLAFLLLGVILASMLLSTRASAIFGASSLAGPVVVALLRPEVPGRVILALGAFLLVASVLVVVSARHRDQLEADRLAEERRREEQLRAADRLSALGTLAASVAHEVNNPLLYIQLHLDQIARLHPEQRSAVEQASHGVEHISSVVRSLSAFARGDDVGDGPVDVSRALDAAIRMVEPHVRGRAQLVRELTPVPPVRGAEHRLEQVFLNLLLNAAQAIPDGAPEDHEIAVRLGLAGDGRIEVAVADTGVGIPAEKLDRVFEPFFTTKPVGSGTGLGLSVSRNIVTDLGGRISVESQVGRGTTFRVSLPTDGST